MDTTTVHQLCAHALSIRPGIIVRYNLQRRILMDGRVVAKCYLWEGSMVADVVSTLPSVLQVRCTAPGLAHVTAESVTHALVTASRQQGHCLQALSLAGLFGLPDNDLVRVLIILRWLRLTRLAVFLRVCDGRCTCPCTVVGHKSQLRGSTSQEYHYETCSNPTA